MVLACPPLVYHPAASCFDQWLEAKKEALKRCVEESRCTHSTLGRFNLESGYLAIINSSACGWLSKQDLQGFRWCKKNFICIAEKVSKNSPMSRRQTQSPGDSFESVFCCQQHGLQSCQAVLSPPLQSRAVLGARKSPVHFSGEQSCHHLPLFIEITALLPSSPVNLVFSSSRRAPLNCE